MPSAGLRGFLYALFALSGFAGLIYESIWTHYLKLFLGHAAYAQTLVLAIFMGGMALGAWLAGERSRHWQRPLLAYAVVEGILGVLALLFDPVFRGLQAWAFDVAIPAMPGPLAIDLLKWSLATALILPQCVLLGTTFPLMSAGVVRLSPETPGRVLGWLYFTNSLGASVGVLLSGFVLIAWYGLPGTLVTAGVLNLLIVLALWLALRRNWGQTPFLPPANPGQARFSATEPSGSVTDLSRLLLATAFLTGAASFFYEIGWIRMLSLVLGSATHSFEFMLSAFIFGLALGSFWIRRRIETLIDPLRTLGWIQAAMAVLALLTLLVYGQSFEWMASFLATVQSSDGGYLLFNLFSHAVCLVLMLPVTICAGMTLPLITALLIRGGGGERAIGRVYATNTAGAIVGVLLAVHVVMPLLGLRQVIVVGAAVDLALGVWLLRRGAALRRPAQALLGAALAAAVALAAFTRLDPHQLASGVYRYATVQSDKTVLFHRDGKTASVDVLLRADGKQRSISTNGKVDAALAYDAPSADDYTMVLLGAVPLALHPAPRRVAVIGFGSGRTTHVLLHDPRVEVVDTIEIEPAMVEGARHFGAPVQRAFDDPRSRIHYEDAKTFFSRQQRRYDLIISEPSNPWVSGVASLFSREFYAQAQRYLAPEGLFVQWLQLYDIDPPLVATVMRALGAEFGDYQIYASDDVDMLVVARADGPVPAPDAATLAATGERVRALAAWVEIRGAPDLQANRVGGKAVLAPLFESFGLPANSDYQPILDQHAVRQRFLRANAKGLTALQPYVRRLERGRAPEAAASYTDTFDPRLRRTQAQLVGAYFKWRRDGGPAPPSVPGALREALALESMQQSCGVPAVEAVWDDELRGLLDKLGAYLAPEHARRIAAELRSRRCHATAPATLRLWLELLEASAAADHARVRTLAPQILEALPADAPLPEWVVMELLFADVESGQPAAVAEHLRWMGPRAPDTLPVRLLRAHARSLEGKPR